MVWRMPQYEVFLRNQIQVLETSPSFADLRMVAGDGVVLCQKVLLLHLVPDLASLLKQAGLLPHEEATLYLPSLPRATLESGLAQFYLEGQADILQQVFGQLLASKEPDKARDGARDDLEETELAGPGAEEESDVMREPKDELDVFEVSGLSDYQTPMKELRARLGSGQSDAMRDSTEDLVGPKLSDSPIRARLGSERSDAMTDSTEDLAISPILAKLGGAEDDDLEMYSEARQLEEQDENDDEGCQWLQQTPSPSSSSSSGFLSPIVRAGGQVQRSLHLLASDDERDEEDIELLGGVEFENAVTSTGVKQRGRDELGEEIENSFGTFSNPHIENSFGTFSNPHIFSSYAPSNVSDSEDPFKQDIWSEHSRRTHEDPEALMREEIESPSPSILSLEDCVIPTPTYDCHNRHILSPATHSALSVLLRELKARSLSSLTNIEAWMDVFTREFTKLMGRDDFRAGLHNDALCFSKLGEDFTRVILNDLNKHVSTFYSGQGDKNFFPQLGVLLMKRIPTILADFWTCEEDIGEMGEREGDTTIPPQDGSQAAENNPESPEWTTHLPIIRPMTNLPPTNPRDNHFMVDSPRLVGKAFFQEMFAFAAPAPAPEFPPVPAPAPAGWEGDAAYTSYTPILPAHDDSSNWDEVAGEDYDGEGSSPKRAMIEVVAVEAVETRGFVAGPKLRRRAEVRAEMRRKQGGGGGRGASRREARRLRRA